MNVQFCFLRALVATGLSILAFRTASATEPAETHELLPPQVFQAADNKDDYPARHIVATLKACHEPSLWEQSKNSKKGPAHIYRFTWLPSFHPAIVVRVERPNLQDGQARLFVKRLGGKDRRELVLEREKVLSDEEWVELARRITESGFWSMTPHERNWRYENGLLAIWTMHDGAQWVMEGKMGGDYHVVARQSPNDNDHRNCGKYRELCLYLLQLSDIDLKSEKIY